MQRHGSKYFARRGVQRSKLTYSEHSHVAYQIKRNHECSNIYSVITHTLDHWGGVKGQNMFFPERSHVAYQINGNGA